VPGRPAKIHLVAVLLCAVPHFAHPLINQLVSCGYTLPPCAERHTCLIPEHQYRIQILHRRPAT
jgi:hypothetical protein